MKVPISRGIQCRHGHDQWIETPRQWRCYPCDQAYWTKRNAKKKDYRRQYYLANRERILATQRIYERERRATNPRPYYMRFLARLRRENHAAPTFTEAEFAEKWNQRTTASCAICHAPLSNGRPQQNGATLDHNARTGQLRDWLCGGCNLGLGNFREDPAALEAAAAYLRRHTQTHG